MFGGLIAHRGTVASRDSDPRGGVRLRVSAPTVITEGIQPKDSIAIDGVCLTVVAHDDDTIAFDVVPETLARSTLGALERGTLVNVEPSLRLGDRLGGHLVYGHIDGTASILAKEREGQGHRLAIESPLDLRQYLVEKGYVAVDGISLTVAALGQSRFEIALIPETSERTTLGTKDVGAKVNLEVDPVARYALAAAAAYQSGRPTSDELAWAYEI
ncbi:MAG: riboflavin synthase [Candidatus Eremiobacteraeota bacterium]|nr:riboflavin synthase [Candidatus Eremiobacteraeota bacterium]